MVGDMNSFELYESQEPFVTRESILRLFENVDNELKGQPVIDVFIVDYLAIVIARKNNRGSNDIDIIPSRFSRVFAEHGLEVFDEHYFLSPDGL
ncbi:hypothetical protein ACFPPD_09930 [Cohnella suwonensis]|uniref:Uncharacterized protein n=1 Tax=Cohnella suwonensis TaxID=696072 RepID=A0ABW0LW16_9BACL